MAANFLIKLAWAPVRCKVSSEYLLDSVGGKIISGQILPIAGRTAIARGGKIYGIIGEYFRLRKHPLTII